MNGKIFKVRGDVKIIKTGEIGYISSIDDYQKLITVYHGGFYGKYKAEDLEPMDIEPETFFVSENGIYTKMCDGKISEKPVRGLRAGKFIEESCNMSKEDVKEVFHKFNKPKENNLYLTQKERNVIRCDIESTLHKFESEVDNTLRTNELELAKINHNVVDTCRSILDKFQLADYEDLENSKYYLTIDLDRQGENKAILFRQYEDKLKIDKFIDFYERDMNKIAQKLIAEIKPYKNGEIIIPNVVFGQNLIDFIKGEGFEDIIELDLKDINKCNVFNLELFNDKNKIYNLSDVNIGGKEYHTEFIRLKKQLDNLIIKTNTDGSNSRFEIKDKDIDKYWTICVFYTLYKLGYKL